MSSDKEGIKMRFYEIFTIPECGDASSTDDMWVVYNMVTLLIVVLIIIVSIVHNPIFAITYFSIGAILSLLMGFYWFCTLRNENFLRCLEGAGENIDSYKEVSGVMKTALFTIGLVFVHWLAYLPIFIFRYSTYRHEAKGKVPFWIRILKKVYKKDIVESKIGSK